MSRVTVEDCLEHIGDHFKLAHLASKRAIQLSNGSPSLIEKEEKETITQKKEKAVVTALREVAAGLINEKFFEQEVENEINQKLQVADWIRVAREKNQLQKDNSEKSHI